MNIPIRNTFIDHPLNSLTTYNIGGTGKYLFYPENLDELIQVYNFIFEHRLQYFIIGEGSNTLIGSGYYNGAVISTKKLNNITVNQSEIKAECGTSNTQVSLTALEKSLTGAEFLYKLPGSIAGSAFMNAKAYGKEMKDIVKKVTVLEPPDKIKVFPVNEINYNYKDSIFQHQDTFLFDITIELTNGNSQDIEKTMENNYSDRKSKHQFDYPSAGCVFKNVYSLGISTGKLIDDLGLKGKRIGNAEIATFHGNFIINHGNATSTDVIDLINIIKNEAKNKIGVELECEIQFKGNFDII